MVLNWIQRSGTRCDTVGGVVPVPWQRGHRGHKWSINGSTCALCSVTEELKADGMDDVCEWWLVSTLADLFIRIVGPQGNA